MGETLSEWEVKCLNRTRAKFNQAGKAALVEIAVQIQSDLAAARERIAALEAERQTVDVLFDGPPGPEAGRFVEVEDLNGRSIKVGEWLDRGAGYFALRLTIVRPQEPQP